LPRCQHCGDVVSDYARYCPRCGNEVSLGAGRFVGVTRETPLTVEVRREPTDVMGNAGLVLMFIGLLFAFFGGEAGFGGAILAGISILIVGGLMMLDRQRKKTANQRKWHQND